MNNTENKPELNTEETAEDSLQVEPNTEETAEDSLQVESETEEDSLKPEETGEVSDVEETNTTQEEIPSKRNKKSDKTKKVSALSSFFASIKNDIIGTWIGAALLVIVLGFGIFWAIDTLSITPTSQTDLVRYGFLVLVYILMGIAATITIRAKGLDLSLPVIMLFSSMMLVSNPTPLGLITAVLLCVVLGAVNGALIVYLKVNSIAVTLLSAIAFRGIMLLSNGADELMLSPSDFEITYPVSIIITVIIAAAAILYTLFTHLKQPMYLRSKQCDGKSTNIANFAAYGLSGFIAGFAGIFLASFLGGYSITVIQPFSLVFYNYELLILFVAFAAISSKLFDNKVMAIASAVLFSIAYSLIDITCAIVISTNSEAVFLVQMLFAICAMVFVLLSLYNKRTAAKICACSGCGIQSDELVAGYDPEGDKALTEEDLKPEVQTAEESETDEAKTQAEEENS